MSDMSALYANALSSSNEILYWNPSSSGYIDGMSASHLITHELIRLINFCAENMCTPYWVMNTISICSTKWHVLFIYTKAGMSVDPLYKWLHRKTLGQINTCGVCYMFKRKYIRTICLDVFTHLLSISAGGTFATIPKIYLISPTPLLGTIIPCLCGERYELSKWKSHKRTRLHTDWMEMCSELTLSTPMCYDRAVISDM